MMTVRLTATPGVALQPEPIRIVADGFARGARLRLGAALTDDAGVVWAALGNFVADHDGAIDLDQHLASKAPTRASTRRACSGRCCPRRCPVAAP